MEIIYNLSQLDEVAQLLLKKCNLKLWLFEAEMGVGKTTLIKAIARQLGVAEVVSSPTYSIVNEYKGTENTIYHFDFYRIENENEVLDIGIEEYFESADYCFIEWPDRIKNLIPIKQIKIKLTKNQNGSRNLQIV